MSESPVPPGLDPDILKRVVTIEVDSEHIEGMRHRAVVDKFTFYSDEPPQMDGKDDEPSPLHYLAAGIGL